MKLLDAARMIRSLALCIHFEMYARAALSKPKPTHGAHHEFVEV
jgi:hypothetical protein